MSGQSIRVTIINDSRIEECEGGCAIDWAEEESLRLAGQRIKDRFDDRIDLTCVDLADDEVDPDLLKWSDEIKSKNLSPPLLVLDGKLRIAGNFDIRQLLDTIEVEMELKV